MAEDSQGENETGSGLRKQLDKAIETNKALTERLVKLEAKELIETKGWATVKLEDFDGVELDGLEEHGEKLHAERVGLVKDLFSKQGFEGDDLERQVQALLAGNLAQAQGESDDEPTGAEGVRSLSSVKGEPPSRVSKAADLHGLAAIEAAFSD